MKTSQKLICVVFLISYFIETASACLALDLLIKVLGAAHLGQYLAYAAGLLILLVLAAILSSRFLSSPSRFVGIHFLLTGIAAGCLFLGAHPVLQTRIFFLTIMGFNVLIYFNNWSLASLFVAPFESKRIFPLVTASGQVGVFLGSLFAMAAHFGFKKEYYFLSWLLAKVVLTVLGLVLMSQWRKNLSSSPDSEAPREKIGIWDVFRNYKLVPKLVFWVFLWGLLLTSMITLTGEVFDKTGLNLTVLYGVLSLSIALGASLSVAFVYPRVVRWLKLGTILWTSSIGAVLIGGTYLFWNVFPLALCVYVFFSLVDASFNIPTLSTQFSLYPAHSRDKIRLLGEIFALSVGSVCVGVVFSFPETVIPWIIAFFLLLLLLFGFLARRSFTQEVMKFLRSKDIEEQDNAIAIFDMPEREDGYQAMMEILTQGQELSLQLGVLETFANLGTTKPAPTVIQILKSSKVEPLRIACLRYFENIKIKELDPFLTYLLFERLQELCYAQVSYILRAKAIKLWVQNGPSHQTVDFFIKALNDENDRVVANAIEGLNYLDYVGVVEVLSPFLKHSVPRVRANAIVTLWKYRHIRARVEASLREMVTSSNFPEVLSGVWAAGEVRDGGLEPELLKLSRRTEKQIQRGTAIALLKLGHEEYVPKIVDVILGQDEKEAVNMSYLSLALDSRILNEGIIAMICQQGDSARQLAIARYIKCGGFCRTQIELLRGREKKTGGYASLH